MLLLSRVNDHERADESNVQGEYNGVPGRREQPTNGSEHTIVSSIRTDLIFKRSNGRRAYIVGPTIEPALIKTLVETSINQSASNSNIESR